MHLPIEIGMSLDDVSSIRFLFVQDNVRMIWDYPSSDAVREDGTNNVILRWTAEQTAKFVQNRMVRMDTLIRLVGSDDNPETEIVNIRMNESLFVEGEVAQDD